MSRAHNTIGRTNFVKVTIAYASHTALCVAVFRDLISFAPAGERVTTPIMRAMDEAGGRREVERPVEGVDWIFGWPHRNSKKVRALQAAWALHSQETPD